MNAAQKRTITRTDILPMAEYERVRKERRAEVIALKRDRRMEVGPFCTFHFECYATMWHQIHEMLRIEKGGEAQIEDELRAYNPLIPNGRELIATVMFEIEDPVRRERELRQLTGIEETCSLTIGNDKVAAVAESEVERTKEDGKTSSIHFLKFPLTDAQATAFKDPSVQAMLGFSHPNYLHLAILPPAVRKALIADLA
ncbi:DUF3501 family protein [Desertibaculum subflavum]|uniref:DUF3501 family protein n=1 Tax=Desertibaculum subflavum TaxID=2268458 RepID=UPI000E66328B